MALLSLLWCTLAATSVSSAAESVNAAMTCADAIAALSRLQAGPLSDPRTPGRAAELCDAATRSNPGDGDAWAFLALARHLVGRHADARNTNAQAVALDSTEAFWVKGLTFHHGLGVDHDFAEAERWYRQAAERGHADAQFSLGQLFLLQTRERTRDPVTAAAWYRKAAQHGLADAEFGLGLLHALGDGVRKDIDEAGRWMEQAASRGSAHLAFILGGLYERGELLPEDMKAALRWYRQAADQGHEVAQNNLGWHYTNGVGVASDPAVAVGWYRRAAGQGNAVAKSNLGFHYATGTGVERNIPEAVRHYTHAANQGYAHAQIVLGQFHHWGKGVRRNPAAAVRWYRKAAEQGDAYAQCLLGWHYATGDGIERDHAQAVHWYRNAARQGHPGAQHLLGWHYRHGQGVEPDALEAFRWYRRAAQSSGTGVTNPGTCHAESVNARRSYSGSVGRQLVQSGLWFYRSMAEQGNRFAQFQLGVLYDEGVYVGRDRQEALRWYRKAAQEGHAGAQARLGDLYLFGVDYGIQRDGVQAVRWYREAANQGDADAQSQLGRTILYINPEGSESRHADAAKWLHRAAEKGQPEAAMELGVLHARGDGVERDPILASELFARASESGVDVAGRLVFLRDRQTLRCVAHGECGSGVDRISALGGLALLHDDRAIPTLTAMLDNDDPSVRVRSIRALQSLGDGRTAAHLADRLEDKSAAVRSAAVTALGALGEADVVESLMEHLDDEDPAVRTSAAKALLRLGEARALPVLRKATGEKAVSSTIQAAALAAFGDRVDPRRLEEALLGGLGDFGDLVELADVLAVNGDRTMVPRLIEALGSSNGSTAERAANALRRLGGSTVFEPILSHYGDSEEAAVAIGEMGDTVAPELIDAYREQRLHPKLLPAVARMLATYRVDDGAALLVDHLRKDDDADGYPDGRHYAAKAAAMLHAIGSTEAVHALLRDQAQFVPNGNRLLLVDELYKVGDPDASQRLMELITPTDACISDVSDDFCVRAEAAMVAGVVPWATQGLVDLLAHPDEDVVWKSIIALGALRSPSTVGPLEKLARGGSGTVRVLAAEAIAEIGVLGPLLELAFDEDVRISKLAQERLSVVATHWSGDAPDTTAALSLVGGLGRVQDPLSRRAIVKAAVELTRPSPSIESMVRLLRSDHERVRCLGIDAVGVTRDDRALDALMEMVVDDDTFCVDSQYTLPVELAGELGNADTVARLIELLEQPSPYWFEYVIDALGSLGDVAAVEPLIGLLDDVDVRLASVEALGRLGDLRALGPVRKLLEWEDDRLAQVERAQVVIALLRLGDDDAGRWFVELLRDDDLEVRDMAWDALDDLGNASSKSLIRMIENDSERIRIAAIAHLGQSDGPAAVDRLTEFLVAGWPTEHAKRFVWPTVDAIARVGGARAVEVLLRSSGERRDGEVNEFRELEELAARYALVYTWNPLADVGGASRLRAVATPEALLRLVEQTVQFHPNLLFLVQEIGSRGAYRQHLRSLEWIWRWRYRADGPSASEVASHVRNLRRSLDDDRVASPYVSAFAAVLAGRVGDYDAMLVWCREGLHASTDDEPVLLMALEVLCAEALVALGDHRAAQRVIRKAHKRVEAPNGLMPLEKIGFLSMVRAEVWMTRAFVATNAIASGKDCENGVAAALGYEAEAILRTALRLGWISRDLYERLLTRRIYAIQQHVVPTADERRWLRLDAMDVLHQVPLGIQEE